jgi:hypothetical protein
MSRTLAVLAVFAFCAYASQDDIVPEQELNDPVSFFDVDEAVMFLQENAHLAQSDTKAALGKVSDMLQTAAPRDISKLKEAIKALIDEVKTDHAADTKKSQATVNRVGERIQSCADKPEKDKEQEEEVNTAQDKLDTATTNVANNGKGKVKYNLGDSTTSSAVAVKTVNTKMTTLKEAFDALIGKRIAANSALKAAKKLLAEKNANLKTLKHQCYCLRKKAFDTVFKTENDATERNHELAHFHTVDCLMTQYEKGNMHKHAAKHCTNEYDKLAKTKNLDGKMGIVGDDRFATGCDKFEGTATPPVHRDTKTMCSMTTWDPTDAECANYVKEHGCAVTYGSICTTGTAVPHAATLAQGCPKACTNRDTKTMCSMTTWDPTDAECANFVKEHGCSATYGSICTEGTAVAHAATLAHGCPKACVPRDTKTMCSMTKWDPTAAECANFVKEHTCSATYGSVCTEGTAVPHDVILEKGCPVACASFTKEKVEKKEKADKEVAEKAQAKADAAAAKAAKEKEEARKKAEKEVAEKAQAKADAAAAKAARAESVTWKTGKACEGRGAAFYHDESGTRTVKGIKYTNYCGGPEWFQPSGGCKGNSRYVEDKDTCYALCLKTKAGCCLMRKVGNHKECMSFGDDGKVVDATGSDSEAFSGDAAAEAGYKPPAPAPYYDYKAHWKAEIIPGRCKGSGPIKCQAEQPLKYTPDGRISGISSPYPGCPQAAARACDKAEKCVGFTTSPNFEYHLYWSDGKFMDRNTILGSHCMMHNTRNPQGWRRYIRITRHKGRGDSEKWSAKGKLYTKRPDSFAAFGGPHSAKSKELNKEADAQIDKGCNAYSKQFQDLSQCVGEMGPSYTKA